MRSRIKKARFIDVQNLPAKCYAGTKPLVVCQLNTHQMAGRLQESRDFPKGNGTHSHSSSHLLKFTELYENIL